MNVLQSITHIMPNIITFFGASGGVAPYVFTLEPDGAGGTIDPATGKYTAPSTINTDAQKTIDTIKVTDDVGDFETSQIFICSPLEMLCDIIRKEMELNEGQVHIFDQKFTVPNDSRIYVSVGELSEKPFAKSKKQEVIAGKLYEVQTENFRLISNVDIYSKSTEALYRKSEAAMAINSDYAIRQQEANNFHIAPLTGQMNNISEIDGSGIPYRFNFSVTMKFAKSKVKLIPYYDTFETPSVETEQ